MRCPKYKKAELTESHLIFMFLNSPLVLLDALCNQLQMTRIRKEQGQQNASNHWLVYSRVHAPFNGFLFHNSPQTRHGTKQYILYLKKERTKCHVLGRHPCIHSWNNIWKTNRWLLVLWFYVITMILLTHFIIFIFI